LKANPLFIITHKQRTLYQLFLYLRKTATAAAMAY